MPTEIWITPAVKPVTGTGLQLSVFEPRPKTPFAPSPQHWTPPDIDRTQLCWMPTPIAAVSVRPETVTGMLESTVAESFPNCRFWSRPQQRTVPFGRTEQVCISSAPMAPNVDANVVFDSLVSAEALSRTSAPAISKSTTRNNRPGRRENWSTRR